MEDLKTVSDLLRPWNFKCTRDLRDAYFTIPLHAKSQKFTPLPIQRKNVSIQLSPIRVDISPLHFYQSAQTNYTGMLRKMVVRIIVNLDDMLIMNSTYRAVTGIGRESNSYDFFWLYFSSFFPLK